MTTSPLAPLRASLTSDRAALHAAVARVPRERHGQPPGPGRWSVQEVLEHLSIVEARAVMMVRALVEAAPACDAASAGLPPTAIDRARLADRAARVSAPDPIVPTGTVTSDAALAALDRSRADLLAVLDSAEGKDLSRVTRPHPALGPLDGYQWIGAIGGHEMRHTLQIEEIARDLGAQPS